MSLSITRRIGLGAALVLFLDGCVAGRLPRTPLPEAPDRIRGYSALCYARYRSEEKGWRARVAVAFLVPDRIRLEVMDPAGNSRAVLIATGEGTLVLDPLRRVFRSYPSAFDGTAALMGFTAPPQFLGRLLLGPVPLLSGFECDKGNAPVREGLGRCSLPGGGELVFAESGEARVFLNPADGTRLDLRWGGESPGKRSLPRWIEIHRSSPEVLLRIETLDLRFSMPDEELFSLRPPAGFAPGRVEEVP